MLGNNFKTILKEERWSKLPTFTVFSRRKSEAAMGIVFQGAEQLTSSVADPDPGSRIRCLFDPWIQNPEKGFSRSRIYPRSQTHIFGSLVTIFWVKSPIILENWPKFFSSACQKENNFQFCEKNVQVTEEAFSSQKRPSNTSKHEIFQFFFTFVGHFCPPGSGFRIRIWTH